MLEVRLAVGEGTGQPFDVGFIGRRPGPRLLWVA